MVSPRTLRGPYLWPGKRTSSGRSLKSGRVQAIGGVYQEKKGADGGMDGFIPLSEGGRTEQCIIQVKSGGIGLKDAKELNSTIDYFKARCGVLFTIESPTKPILEYIAGLPPYRPRWGAVELESVPRIQVITAAEHFPGSS